MGIALPTALCLTGRGESAKGLEGVTPPLRGRTVEEKGLGSASPHSPRMDSSGEGSASPTDEHWMVLDSGPWLKVRPPGAAVGSTGG